VMYLCLCSVYIAHSDRDSELFPGTTDIEVSEAVLKKSHKNRFYYFISHKN
jgi:hypothetical protein